MTIAELTVRTLDLAKENYCEESDLDSEQLRLADRVKELYREYRRHMDLITAARMARVAVVQEILESKVLRPLPANFSAPRYLRPLPTMANRQRAITPGLQVTRKGVSTTMTRLISRVLGIGLTAAAFAVLAQTDNQQGREYIRLGGRIIAVENLGISTPNTPTGPSTATTGTSSTYTAGGSTSSLGNPVQYQFTWGDGTTSPWLSVGTPSAAKAWSASGSYSVTVQARDSVNTALVSAQSQGLLVTVGPTYAIAGTISGPSSCISNVSVTLSGAGQATTYTNGSGGYSFTGLNPGNYTISPFYSYCVFTPASTTVTITNASITASFTATQASANLYISNTSFYVGSTYTLWQQTNMPNTPFSVCISINNGATSCTPTGYFGKTDANGNWMISGTMPPQTGSWQEWVVFPNNTTSNIISFTVSNYANLTINTTTFHVGDTWTLALQSSIPSTSFDICIKINGVQMGCQATYGSTDANGSWGPISGTMPNQTGNWQEWVRFPALNNFTSNIITFTVNP